MAKVTITIEDLPNGKVKCEMHPNFSKLIHLETDGGGLSVAQGYALVAINAIRKTSASNKPRLLVPIPKLYKA